MGTSTSVPKLRACVLVRNFGQGYMKRESERRKKTIYFMRKNKMRDAHTTNDCQLNDYGVIDGDDDDDDYITQQKV